MVTYMKVYIVVTQYPISKIFLTGGIPNMLKDEWKDKSNNRDGRVEHGIRGRCDLTNGKELVYCVNVKRHENEKDRKRLF